MQYAIKLSNNRLIIINARIKSLPFHIPILSTFAPSLELESVYLGDLQPTAQLYWLYNSGCEDAEYIVDTKPLERLAATHYDVNVLKCLNPMDIVKAKNVHPIMFRFSPIELRNYEVL